jgi:hypothetical protein
MTKLLGVSLLILAASGCASIDHTMQSWVGSPEGDAIASWGPPQQPFEIHGSVWTQGHHTRGEGFLDDREKVFAAQLEGWIVGEVSTQQVKSGLLAQRVADAIAYRVREGYGSKKEHQAKA